MKGQVTAPLLPSMASSHIFKIMFVNQGKVYEVYARKVGQGRLFGFIEVEELVFGERSTVVLDPAEERIAADSLPFLHCDLEHGTAELCSED